MCNFLSALVFSDGKIFSDPEHTDSHSDLIRVRGLDDSRPLETRGWIRVEFKPDNNDTLDQPEMYKLTVDELAAPAWFDNATRFDITERLREQVEKMIVRDRREILLGGCWILARGAKVVSVKNGLIQVMYDSSQVNEMYDSSRVNVMYGSSQVNVMYGSSQVNVMRDSSQVNEMHGSSQVANDYRVKKASKTD
jgi:hypothetical protein